MSYVDTLQDVLTRGPTPAASATALLTLGELAQAGDFAADRALAGALATALGYDDALTRISHATSPADLLEERAVPPILRVYLVGLSPRIFLHERKRCSAVAIDVEATDDFGRFQRLVRREDLLQHEALKAYALTALALLRASETMELLPPSGLMHVLDLILVGSRVVPGAEVDTSFSVGRDKILAIDTPRILWILGHELGHHVFDCAIGGGRGAFTDVKDQNDADAEQAALTPAIVAEFAAGLPALIIGARNAREPSPQRLVLASGLSVLLSLRALPAGPYLHISLTDRGGPISREIAGDYALLIMTLIGADTEGAAAAISPRGVFHFGVHGRGPDESELRRRPETTDSRVLLVDLRKRSTAWLNQLDTGGRLTSDGNDVPVGLGLLPPKPLFYPSDATVWEDLTICQQLRTASSGIDLSLAQLERAITAAIATSDDQLLCALLAAGGQKHALSSDEIARAGRSLAVIDDHSGTKHYVGSTPHGMLAVLTTLRDHGCDLNCPVDERGTTLLIAAAQRAPRTASALLTLGADANRADKTNETPLHAAARNGWSVLVGELIKAGSSVAAQNANGATPLILAAEQDDLSVTEILLAHGASAVTADRDGTTALMVTSNVNILERLLGAGANPDARDHTGATALMHAAGRGRAAVVRALLDAGADPEAAANHGDTALHRAALVHDKVSQEACFAALLAAGADVNEETSGGVTPLMAAARAGLPAALRYLLANGASVDARTSRGHTALILACDPGGQWSRDFTRLDRTEECARVLAAANADLDATSQDGTALHHAAHFFASTLVKTLLELGADPNVRTQLGTTPLMSAAAEKHPDMVNALVTAGADVNAADRDGNTAIFYAIRGEVSQDYRAKNTGAVVELLLSHGADASIRNAAGESAAVLVASAPLSDEVKARIALTSRKQDGSQPS